MNTILDIAGYMLGATVLLGVVIAFFLIRAYWYQPRAVVSHPTHLKLPTEAVNAVREALEDAKRRLAMSSGAEHETLSREVLRLEARLEKIEQKTFDEQREYHFALKLRESAWLHWNELHDRAASLGKRMPQDMRDLLAGAMQKYSDSHREVEQQRHTAVARDMVNLEEIRGQGVLTQADEEEPGYAAARPEAPLEG